MQVLPRCRSSLILQNWVNFCSTQFASFHSSPVCNDKWKNKWKSDFKRGQQPSKTYSRYATRQKRADAKRALRSLLSNYGDVGTAFENYEQSWKVHGTNSWDIDIDGHSNSSAKKSRSKSDSHRAQKIHNHRMRRKFRKGYLSEDDDDYSETVFHATFGDRWYTWSFNSRTGSSQRSAPGFDWRETSQHKNDGQEEWGTANEPESEDESCDVGLRREREALDLPLNGPLKMQDVKNAFHLSALKWHPDKHQGHSQAAAEEKFKVCVNAYKSLCSVLSGV